MEMEYIRQRDLPEIYCISEAKAYRLTREFRAQTKKENWIKDGHILIVKKKAFEDWWRNRG